MLGAATSLVGSAAAGSAIKIVAGLLQNWSDAKQRREELEHERWMDKQGMAIQAHKALEGSSYTKTTRRILALSVCWTFCIIAAFCTVFPDIYILVLPATQPEPTTHSFLFGLYQYQTATRMEPVYITTGTMAYAAIHFCGMVLGYYFTPIGKK